jgi:hypothetical protein
METKEGWVVKHPTSDKPVTVVAESYCTELERLLASAAQSLVDAQALLEDSNKNNNVTPDIHFIERSLLVQLINKNINIELPINVSYIVVEELSMNSSTNRKFIQELPDGTFRNCTPLEIEDGLKAETHRLQLLAKIEEWQRALDKLSRDCKHPVVYDVAGVPYNVRHCIVCGHVSLL